MTAVPVKRIAAVDGQRDFVERILAFVKGQYQFDWTDPHRADYLFHSIDGLDVLKYQGVRIFITGENVTPDFAVSDYAMAFERNLLYGDRNIWLPLLRLYEEDYQVMHQPRRIPNQVLSQKTDFCAYVMSNTRNSAPEREKIFDLLCQYKKVNSGGAWRNNVGGRVADKLGFQNRHKFVIAFENSSWPGYLTEKFAQAAAADAVPIYWGDPGIAGIFNPEAFVNCHEYDSLEDVVEIVRQIDQDEDRYLAMLTAPWFRDGTEPVNLQTNTYATFLCHIFDQPLDQAFRRNCSRWSKKKERQYHDMVHRPWMQAYRLLRRRWRNFWHCLLPHRRKY